MAKARKGRAPKREEPKNETAPLMRVCDDGSFFEASVDLHGDREADIQIVVSHDRSSGALSVGMRTEGHAMTVLAQLVGGDLQVSASFDSWPSSFLVQRRPARTIHFFSPQFLRLQQAAAEAGFGRSLTRLHQRLRQSGYEFVAGLADPLAAVLGAKQRSFADADSGSGPPFLGIIDPFTLSQRMTGIVILLQAGLTVGPGEVVEVPGAPAPPTDRDAAEEALKGKYIPSGQEFVSSTYTKNGTYKRVKSFVPSAWSATGNVSGGGTFTYYEFVRTVRITFEEVRKHELCITWRCPGSCWGYNDSTHCEPYAEVLRTWTATHTEKAWIWAPDYGPTGTTFPPIPPAANTPPVIDNLTPPP